MNIIDHFCCKISCWSLQWWFILFSYCLVFGRIRWKDKIEVVERGQKLSRDCLCEKPILLGQNTVGNFSSDKILLEISPRTKYSGKFLPGENTVGNFSSDKILLEISLWKKYSGKFLLGQNTLAGKITVYLFRWPKSLKHSWAYLFVILQRPIIGIRSCRSSERIPAHFLDRCRPLQCRDVESLF